MTHQPSGATSPLEDGSPERLAIDTIRTLTLDAVTKAKSGHIGSPLGLAPVAHTVWTRFLDYDPAKPDWPNRDRFVLSVGHASMLLYGALHLASVEEVDADGNKTGLPAVSLDDIKAFRQLDSKTPGHPEYRMTTGVETTTGPLGQGCANSVGMAIATQALAQRFNREGFHLFDHDIYVLCGDGDMMEGVVSEAASLAGHLQLPNLCWIYDSNQVSIEGSTDLAFNEDVGKRFEAYGWRVHHVDDANDTVKIAEALTAFKSTTDRPTMIVVRSVIGYGSPMAGTGKAHGEALGEPDLVAETKRSYGWPEDSSFLVPDGVKEAFTEAVASRGRPQREAWEELFRRYAEKHPDEAQAFELLRQGKLPDGWDKDLPVFPADEKGLATRDAGGKVLNAISPGLPGLMGGAADLSPSTKTDLKWEGAGSFEPGNYAGRNLHFGIREHAMGSVANGMALSYLRSYTGTFLVFLDYMRAPVRLAAIMETPVVFVFTHDSIGVGEDGPTHQPIEQLAMLRATPGLDTIRPGDANETAQAWRVALTHTHEPTALVLSRQAVPTLDREKYASAEGVMKGGYVLGDCEGEPEVVLIGTGSELPLVADAYEKLKADGVRARVVSLPSWYLFEKQDRAYRDSVIPPACKARLAVEQGSELGWDRYVGDHGDTITMSTFGASAPLAKLKEKYGFTTEKVVAKARELIEKGEILMANGLKDLEALGQAVWLDNLERGFLRDGGLRKLVEEDGLTGVTSNPSIFEKAMGHGEAYDDGFKAFLGQADASVQDVYENGAIADIKAAAADLRSVYDRLDGRDGYVSLEVSPYLADETDTTIEEARRLWEAVGEPNLMVKVPGTKSGTPAIRQLLEDGLNINVTLLFSMEAYRAVAEEHLSALEARVAKGEPVDRIASVASFFVSRIDAKIDKAIDGRVKEGDPDADALKAVRGKTAIANAKLAYAWYQEMIASPRWKALADKGAMPQRLLWASTGVKDEAYPDTLYVDSLIGPDTVNTMPPKTMDAVRDHGVAKATLTEGVDQARHVLDEVKRLGLDLDKVTTGLVPDGVKQFSDAADALLGAVAGKRAALLGDRLNSLDAKLPDELQKAVDARLETARAEGWPRRLWHGDATLWTGKDESKWLGWLAAARGEQVEQEMLDKLRELGRGHRDAVLLGMGGSSLGPEVLARMFGGSTDGPRLHVLDSTDPGQVSDVANAVDPHEAIFIVSSKSGSTMEPELLRSYFWELSGRDGARWVAVTDPGSKLEAAAKADGFAMIVPGDPAIGGRYSVLSAFGSVPASVMGMDMHAFYEATAPMVFSCGADSPPAQNPGFQLGAIIGEAALAGRDKLTVLPSKGLEPVGAWLEQLLAESTGKQGHGVVPVDLEPAGDPGVYGDDRLFVHLHLEGDRDDTLEAQLKALHDAGQPVVAIHVARPELVGQEFLRWEVATAVAGAVIGIDAFDQPDVEDAKIATRKLVDGYEAKGEQEPETAAAETADFAVFTPESAPGEGDPAARLKALVGSLKPHDYFGVLAYVTRNAADEAAVQQMRVAVRDRTRNATVAGFGPRFLHSTGQAYKGGPNTGVFLVVTRDPEPDLNIPGHKASFGAVQQMQARGDMEVLAQRGRRVLRVHLKKGGGGMAALVSTVQAAVA